MAETVLHLHLVVVWLQQEVMARVQVALPEQVMQIIVVQPVLIVVQGHITVKQAVVQVPAPMVNLHLLKAVETVSPVVFSVIVMGHMVVVGVGGHMVQVGQVVGVQAQIIMEALAVLILVVVVVVVVNIILLRVEAV